MSTSHFSQIRTLLKRYGLRISVPLLLLLLSVMSLLICRKPAASGLPVAEQCSTFVLPAVALLSVASAAFERYFFSLFTFIGYHMGIAFAILGTNREGDALITAILSLLIFLILGVWAEVFSVLLSKWRKNPASSPDVSHR